MPDPHVVTLEEHRHNEVLEKLDRIAVGVELLNDTADRQLKAFGAADARLEAGLRFFIRAWQASAGEGRARGGDHG